MSERGSSASSLAPTGQQRRHLAPELEGAWDIFRADYPAVTRMGWHIWGKAPSPSGRQGHANTQTACFSLGTLARTHLQAGQCASQCGRRDGQGNLASKQSTTPHMDSPGQSSQDQVRCRFPSGRNTAHWTMSLRAWGER